MSAPAVSVRPRAELVKLLSASMGREKAEECVISAALALGLENDVLTRDDALRVLEQIALEPGIVGITARFAKSRVYLIWDA